MRIWRHRGWVEGLGLAVVVAIVSLVASAADPSVPLSASWTANVPVALKVEGGRSTASLPSSEPSDRYLLIVSALNRTAGRFAINIKTSIQKQAEMPPTPTPESHRKPARIPRVLATAPATPIIPPQRDRTFWLPAREGDSSSPSNHVPIHAVLRDHGDRIAVYVDVNDDSSVSGQTVRDIIATFEEHIVPRALAETGLARDQDGDGRFTILMSSWLGHLADGRLAVDGFVRGADFLDDPGPPVGNRCDMMYLNSSLEAGAHLRTVIAHEYAHAVTFCHKVRQSGQPDEAGWLDEAIAHVTEDEHGFSRTNLDYRVDAFLANPERYRLLVNDYSPPGLIRSHGHRGSAYAFLRWCADHHGPDLLRSLILSDLRGVASLEAATGRGFAELYRDWSVSIFMNGWDASVTGPDLPRHSYLSPGSGEDVVLDGTSTHFAVLEGSRSGALGVEVTASSSAKLQVTVVPLPTDLPRIAMTAAIEEDAGDHPGLRIRLRNRDRGDVQLETLRWFPSSPSSQASERERQSGMIGKAELAQLLGSPTLAGRSYRSSEMIPLPASLERQGLVVILRGRDEKGRTIVARAELNVSEGIAEVAR